MPADFREILLALSAHRHLTRQQAREAILFVCSGAAAEDDIRQLLLGIDIHAATLDELVGAADAMRELAVPLPTTHANILDTCGTGGDVRHTFNISTAAALIAAACGVKIVKHGNRSASSKCGSADVLEHLGVHLEPRPTVLAQCLDQANICFAFARAFHPAMKHVGPIRSTIGKPTLFNLLGPLTNPASAKLHLMGVFAADLTDRLAAVLRETGSRRAWVVHAADGLDEISTIGPTRISELKGGQIRTWDLNPADLGFAKASLSELQVTDVCHAGAALLGVLDNRPGPHRDISLLNAAAALVIAEKATDLADGLKLAGQALQSGAARNTLQTLISLTM